MYIKTLRDRQTRAYNSLKPIGQDKINSCK